MFFSSLLYKAFYVVLLVLSMALVWPFSASANVEEENGEMQIKMLISKIYNSTMHTSFTGRFVHKKGDINQTMQVSRICSGKHHIERIVSVSGKPSEVVRFEDKVWYFNPQTGEAMETGIANEHTGMVGLQISKKLQQNYNSLKEYYNFILGDDAVIAGYDVKQLKVISKDKWRFGYHLWMNEESGLILRTDMYDEDWQLLESYIFEEIKIGKDIAPEKLEPSEELREMVKLRVGDVPKELAVNASKWQFTQLPPGFMVKQRLMHAANSDKPYNDQYLIGDGLGMLSVMISPSEVTADKSTSMQWGTMNVFTRYYNGYKISGLGEAPIHTLQEIVEGVSLKENQN